MCVCVCVCVCICVCVCVCMVCVITAPVRTWCDVGHSRLRTSPAMPTSAPALEIFSGDGKPLSQMPSGNKEASKGRGFTQGQLVKVIEF